MISGCYNKHIKTGEFHLLEILQGLWQKISIDIIGLLPRLNNKNVIVVIVNRFTKIIRLKTTMTVLSEKIAKIYRNNIWKIHRILKKILSDKEPQFALWFIKDLSKVLKMKQTLSMAYPQTNSQITKIKKDSATGYTPFKLNFG